MGALPDVVFFAGRRLAQPLPGGRLLRCRRCDLRFRHPHLGMAAYAQLYDNASVDTWSVGALREDQRLVHEEARASLQSRAAVASGAPRVLDFGCYAGEFLHQLPPGFEKFGVEVNTQAAAVAAARTGAQVVRELGQFPADLRFDLIVAMDVIEHVPSPRALAAQLVQRLQPGGHLVITTGDGGNWLWRLVGGRWWYCYYPEHIAFISRPWVSFHARALGVTVTRTSRFNYLRPAERPGRWRGWRHLLRYLLVPSGQAARQRRHVEAHGTDLAVPGIGLTPDHLLLVLQRPPAAA